MATTTRNKSALAARIEAVNTANAYANELYPRRLEALRPFVGSKVLTADGSLRAYVSKVLTADGPLPCNLQVYRWQSGYSLAWVIKSHATYSAGHHGDTCAVYHESHVTIGSLANGVLTELNENWKPYRTDYTESEVLALRASYDQAREAARQAESALYPFGPCDR